MRPRWMDNLGYSEATLPPSQHNCGQELMLAQEESVLTSFAFCEKCKLVWFAKHKPRHANDLSVLRAIERSYNAEALQPKQEGHDTEGNLNGFCGRLLDCA